MSTRKKETKAREDYHTQNYPHTEGIILPDTAEYKKKTEDKTPKEVKNFSVNFIDDELFAKEVDYLPFKPQGESIIVLGPRVEIPESVRTHQLTIQDETKRELLKEALAKHESGYRVLAISPQVVSQITEQAAKLISAGIPQEIAFNEFYQPGDYVFSPRTTVIRQMDVFKPEDDKLAYYEVFHREVGGFMTQEQALRFKPKEEKDEAKGK